MKKYTVYMHECPNGKKYIGITSMSPKKRWDCGRGYKNNEYFTRSINKYGWENFSHFILFSELSESEAKSKEIELIKKYKSNEREFGFNISSGGESHSGTKISKSHKKAVSIANKGKIVSQETRKKLSESAKRYFSNPKTRENHGKCEIGKLNHRYGIKLTDEEKIARGARPVLQFTLQGEFVGRFISMHEASEKTKISRSTIKLCCSGKYKQAGGFVWKYGDCL